MDTASIAKTFISLQKMALSNSFDAIALFQDQVQRSNKIFAAKVGMDDRTCDLADQWQMTLKKYFDDTRNVIDASLTHVESYFAELEQKNPVEGQATQPKG